MKKLMCLGLLLLFVAGCSGVRLNAKYSRLLDETARLSKTTAERAVAGELSEADKTSALVKQAATWKKFQDARDGKDGD